MVFGRWAHRLSPELEVLASHRLPVARPHNSFVVLDGGELVTKDCDAPAGLEPSTVSVLDPETLLPVAPALRLPEPSIARLASDGESVFAVGTTAVFRLRLDRDAGRLTIDERWRPSYGPAPGRSYGWDPVITDEHVLWMDNGRNHTDRTMLGTGESPDPVRLWWARRDDDRAVLVGGGQRAGVRDRVQPPGLGSRERGRRRLRRGQRRPARLAPERRRARAALASRRVRPRRPPDPLPRQRASSWPRIGGTPQPCAGRSCGGRCGRPSSCSRAPPPPDARLCAPAATSSSCSTSTPERTRRASTLPSPSQAFLFPAPGFERDVYYQSLTTIARVAVTGSPVG